MYVLDGDVGLMSSAVSLRLIKVSCSFLLLFLASFLIVSNGLKVTSRILGMVGSLVCLVVL